LLNVFVEELEQQMLSTLKPVESSAIDFMAGGAVPPNLTNWSIWRQYGAIHSEIFTA
jgi:hypothetical protein